MTVQELRVALENMPPDADVCAGGHELAAIHGIELKTVYRESYNQHCYVTKKEFPSDWRDRRAQVVKIQLKSLEEKARKRATKQY